MKSFVAAVLMAALVAPLHADVTMIQTMTMEGGAAAMMGQQQQLPRVTMRIKGNKARYEIEAMGQTIVSITDLTEKQVIILQPQTKTAQVITPASAAAGTAQLPAPAMDISLKPTGKTQTVEGQICDEYSFTMSLNMAELSASGQVPPEASAMMKDVRMVMNGFVYSAKGAPGAAEFVAFNKAAVDSGLLTAASGMKPGQSGGLDKLLAATASAPGLPYLTEVNMSFEGSGPMVEAMKQMGAMKMVQKVTSVSTDSISDDMFKVPEGYTVDKK